MSDRIILTTQLDLATGYGNHAMALITGLSNRFNVAIRPIKINDKLTRLPNGIREKFVYGVQPEDFEIILHHPDFFPTPGKKIVRLTTWESTRLPPKYVDFLNLCNVVVVPSEWNASCFSASGVEAPIRVVPLGINPTIFNFTPLPEGGPFTFGCGGNLNNGLNRKGVHSIIRLFQAAFGDENVRLKIKCNSNNPIEPHPDARVQLNKEHLSEEEMSKWYSSIHCYISFSTGSWELMPHQAMAVGRPVLGIKFAGMAEYLSSEASFILPHILVPAKDKWHTHGCWGKPEDVDAINTMRHIRNNPETIASKGWKSHLDASKLTWDNSVEKLIKILEEFNLVPMPKQNHPTKPKCFIQLGRYGDIINILPILREERRHSIDRPVLMVAKEYADLLDGVTYVQPLIWDMDFTDVNPALEYATRVYPEIIVPQVYGKNHSITKFESYNRDSWRMAGFLDSFNCLPLVFDNRNFAREKELADQLMDNTKPNIAVCLSGVSSPISNPKIILDELRKIQGIKVVDISNCRSERIYDLLGIMDRSSMLVLSDSAPLHLAAATGTPTVALIADTPSLWHGTSPRCNTIMEVRYANIQDQLHTITRAIETCNSTPRLLHIYSNFLTHGETLRRNKLAHKTWLAAYDKDRWTACPVYDSTLPRAFQDNSRRLPFMKDVINQGVSRSVSDDEVLVWTNTDSCLAPTAAKIIREAMEKYEAVHCHRRDFNSLTRPLSTGEITEGKTYLGTDLLAFKVGWWKKHIDLYPDMVVGAEAVDWCFRELIRSTGGGQIEDVVYHERHRTEWEQNRFGLLSNKHNHALAKPFLTKLGVYSGEFGKW